MTAVVTGASGFLGSPLAQRLAASGARVISVDNIEGAAAPTEDSLRLDILDADSLRSAFVRRLGHDARSAVVIHLAARAHTGACRDDPGGAVAVNVVGTTNVLEACRAAGVRRVIFPSTALVYRLPAESPITEEALVAPRSIYAATKLACESLLAAYVLEYEMHCTVARLGNVYGRGAAPDSVAAIITRQILAGGPVEVEAFAPVRDFIYRDDVVSAFIALAASTEGPNYQVVNVSSGVPTSIRELAETACAVAGLRTRPSERSPRTGADHDRLVLSIDRMITSTGWRPSFTVEDGLRATLTEAMS